MVGNHVIIVSGTYQGRSGTIVNVVNKLYTFFRILLDDGGEVEEHCENVVKTSSNN